MGNGSIIMLSLSFGESHQLAEVDEGRSRQILSIPTTWHNHKHTGRDPGRFSTSLLLCMRIMTD